MATQMEGGACTNCSAALGEGHSEGLCGECCDINQAGLLCPECRSGAHLDVAATVWVRLTPDGSDADEAHARDHEWEDDSACRCDGCDWTGTVRAARAQGA